MINFLIFSLLSLLMMTGCNGDPNSGQGTGAGGGDVTNPGGTLQGNVGTVLSSNDAKTLLYLSYVERMNPRPSGYTYWTEQTFSISSRKSSSIKKTQRRVERCSECPILIIVCGEHDLTLYYSLKTAGAPVQIVECKVILNGTDWTDGYEELIGFLRRNEDHRKSVLLARAGTSVDDLSCVSVRNQETAADNLANGRTRHFTK
ncbi:MAG: hypothetical protein SPD11_06700 [Sphaerochaetaceae bacterium]|nr:hypothetical protein [Sphaerochaetaceae bacterium]